MSHHKEACCLGLFFPWYRPAVWRSFFDMAGTWVSQQAAASTACTLARVTQSSAPTAREPGYDWPKFPLHRSRASERLPDIRVGCSGWQYKHWRGDFYPADVPADRWLEHYARVFDTVEINNSFYRLPDSSTVRAWRKRVPADFLFTWKGEPVSHSHAEGHAPRDALKLMGLLKGKEG